MSLTPGTQSLEGFSAIGTGIYLRDIREQCQDTTSPNVILIFGWMGAQLRHLQNYTHAYTKLYPKASQIVVRCNPDVFWTTTGTRERRLMPVIDALEALHCLPSSSPAQPPPRILTHVFSNGGSLQMTLLGNMLKRKYGSALIQGFIKSALILDSCPAVGNLRTIKLAFSAVFRNPILRFIVLSMIYTMHFVGLGLSLLLGKRIMLMENLRIEMWNPRVLPWMGLHTPRLYLFSRKDKLIPWQDVTQHAEISKERGMDVHCELFEESEHVAHIRVEPERYWSSVQVIWAAAISKEKDEDKRILN
ncbi:hypothetical protein DEU56DRAFT_421830 [Suillus clintonianus]|uniref:uncharacterized protein n=1 Tax=Suillus clintonianus TaxID=1904413 RepID=UPI001B85E274|nr:uncharacterized protein DEU56DRAFT_421830 [Suillus clintonianus]KAG2132951.1 hypothetical protein DEU56DRAFT_421830 [Suillus clintonianus]